MTIEIDLSEIEGIADLLATAPLQARDAAYSAGVGVGEKVKRGAMADAPRDRPWLASEGVRKKSWKDQAGSHTDIFTVEDDEGRNVGYYVEFGTSDTPPVPFLSQQIAWASGAFETEVLDRVDPLTNPGPEVTE